LYQEIALKASRTRAVDDPCVSEHG
jgi:hypothetical protein